MANTTRSCLLRIVAFLMAATPCSAVFAQEAKPDAGALSSTATSARAAKLAPSDAEFLRKAAAASAMEIELGKLAQNSSDPAVKSFGSRLMDDHATADEELRKLASARGVALPSEPDAKQRAEVKRLSKLAGKPFDDAFLARMVAEHKATEANFAQAAKSAKDPELRAWAQRLLPTLQNHLKMAEDGGRSVMRP
jgi:putative membrane protein